MTIQQQQEATIITDASLQIQFANRAAECLFHTKAVRHKYNTHYDNQNGNELYFQTMNVSHLFHS